ncbi:MAG: PAS domain-containing protein [Verrucomicrobia bacterium]|nr:PAS domain-containing protein [Verrucomicrobiota bacterium]
MNAPYPDQAQLTQIFLNQLNYAVFFKDKESRFRLVNPALLRALRAGEKESVIGKTDADYFTSEHAAQALADEQEIIRTGKPQLNYEEKETYPDGTVGWSSTSKYPLRGENGDIVGTFGISLNITAQKAAEARLAKAQAELMAKERKLAVVDFADLILFHMNQMGDAAGAAIGRVSAAIQNGHFTQMRQQVEALVNRLPGDSPVMQELVSLLGETELEAEQQAKIHDELIALRQELKSIIELVELRKNMPAKGWQDE